MSQEHQGSLQSDCTQDNLVIVVLPQWSTLTLSFTKCITLLSCCVLFAMVTTALRDVKETNTANGNQSNTLKRMCVWNSLLLKISVWLHNWSCRCDTDAETSWNHQVIPVPWAQTQKRHTITSTPTLTLFFFFYTHSWITDIFSEYNLHH